MSTNNEQITRIMEMSKVLEAKLKEQGIDAEQFFGEMMQGIKDGVVPGTKLDSFSPEELTEIEKEMKAIIEADNKEAKQMHEQVNNKPVENSTKESKMEKFKEGVRLVTTSTVEATKAGVAKVKPASKKVVGKTAEVGGKGMQYTGRALVYAGTKIDVAGQKVEKWGVLFQGEVKLTEEEIAQAQAEAKA